jgi:Lrp/AsnC family leucine-responsive transcriptional regulator
VKILQKNARTSLTDMASNVGVSKVTVGYRIKRLEDEGIILRSVLQVDLTKFGYECVSIVLVEIIPLMEDMQDYIKKIANECGVTTFFLKSINSCNILIQAYAKTVAELHEFASKIKRNRSVENIKLFILTDIPTALTRPENISLNHLKRE